MYFNDLDPLIDVIDEVIPQEDIHISEDDRGELLESVLQIMEDYITANPKAITEPEFEENLLENAREILYTLFDEKITDQDFCLDLDLLLDEAEEIFYETLIPPRSYPDTFIIEMPNAEIIAAQIKYLQDKPQPAQRTKEWYTFRHNLITASNAYKAFENESAKNQLIFEKCKPLITSEEIARQGPTNINTTLHWGQKYEPLSVMLYEYNYNTKVGDFGCIQHETYGFLGASPDGINIDPLTDRYGRMLEIKNIVNREIDLPKKEYWIQMQLQMEVCNLNECDFLETQFLEYKDDDEKSAYQKFVEDGTFTHTEAEQRKGIIMYFAKPDGNPFYEYMPLNIQSQEEYEKWETEIIDKNEANKMAWIANCYWRLHQYSCVLVERNTKWFNDNIQDLTKIWDIILDERISGYQHRAPAKRNKKDANGSILDYLNKSGGCILNINKLGKVTVNKIPPLEKVEPK